MLKNARIWSKAAALMRAQVLKCPGFRPLENDEHLLFVYHLNESQTRSPAVRRWDGGLESEELFRMEWMKEIAVSGRSL
jgi:hypothetical protein